MGSRGETKIVYDFRDERGVLLYQEVRGENADGSKTIRLRRPDPENPNNFIYKLGTTRRVVYNLDKLQGQPACAIVEGAKCADRLTKAGLLATTNPNGAGNWRDDYTQQLEAAGVKCVVLFPDQDSPGEKHVAQVRESCEHAGLTVYTVRLPGLPPKGDVSDFLDTHTAEEFFRTFSLYRDADGFHLPEQGIVEHNGPVTIPRALLEQKLADMGGTPDEISDVLTRIASSANPVVVAEYEPDMDVDRIARERPIIVVNKLDLAETVDACWMALKHNNNGQLGPVLYRRGDTIVRLALDPDGKGVVPRRMNRDRMADRLSRVAHFRTETVTRRVQPAYPPDKVVGSLLSNEEPPLPILRRVVRVPVFASDGRLLATPGYDASSGVFYGPPPNFAVPPVPPVPSAEDVTRARQLILDDVLVDFPFVTSADTANFVALLLTMFARDLFEGVIPLFLIEKPTPGTGASLLLDVIGQIVLGRRLEKMSEAGTDEEWRKRITSCLLESPPFIVIDNIRQKLDSGALATALTSGIWQDRALGSNRMLTLEVLCPWIGTANNPSVSGEMARRTVPCRMDARLERPDQRIDFKHPQLLAWIDEHRGDLVLACLTLVQNWIARGRKPGGEHLASYEQWSAVLGGILRDADISGYLTNLAEFRDRADTEGKPMRAFVAAWWKAHSETAQKVKDLLPVANDIEDLDLGKSDSEKARQIRLGLLLKRTRDTRYRLEPGVEVRIVSEGDRNGTVWKLSRVDLENIPQNIPQDNSASDKELRYVRDDAGCLADEIANSDDLFASRSHARNVSDDSQAENIPHYPQHPAGRPAACRRHPVTPRPDLCPECAGCNSPVASVGSAPSGDGRGRA